MEPPVREVRVRKIPLDLSHAGVLNHLERLVTEAGKAQAMQSGELAEVTAAVQTLRRLLCRGREGV